MGKFKTLIKSEQPERRHQKTGAALQRMGFAHSPGSGCWERRLRAGDGTLVHAALNLDTGLLWVHGSESDRHYEIPVEISKHDSAQAAEDWLDRVLEEWL